MPTPQRLPIVNSDDGVWGDIIRQYLMKEHYNDDTDNAVNGGHQKITVRAGTTAAGTAPIKLTSGPLMTTPEAGAIEFLSDKLYFTQTTSTTRKTVAAYDDTSGATGDIYYRDSGGSFVRLGIGSSNNVLTVSGGVPSWQAPGSTFSDSSFTIQDNTDATKQVKFEASGLTTATTRTLTVPDANTTIVGTDAVQTLANKTLTAPVLTGATGVAQSGSLAIYNTSDQTTNYERVRQYWASNIYTIASEQGGTGVSRAVRIASGLGYMSVYQSAGGPTLGTVQAALSTTNTASATIFGVNGTLTSSSGLQYGAAIAPTYNQSSTAGYTALLVNPTETATGSGTKLLADFQVGGTSKTRIDNTGSHVLSSGALLTLFNTADETTNYERVRQYWNSNVYTITSEKGGTGTQRNIQILAGGGVSINTSTTSGAVNLTGFSSSNNSGIGVLVSGSTSTASSGSFTALSTTFTANQSSTAGYTGVLVNVTETTTGSGAKLLADFQVGSSSKFKIDNTGVATAAAAGTAAGSVVTVDGAQTLTNKTLTAPKISQIYDVNGNETLILGATASAVNEISITNAVTTVSPSIAASGNDTNISLELTPKGTGRIKSGGVIIPSISSADTLTNKTISGSSNTLSNIALASLATTGTPSSSNYLRGDGAWTAITAGDASTNTATSVDSEIALFSGTGGKTLKRATGSGIALLTSGVLSTVTAPSGTIVGTSDTQTLTSKTLTAPKIDGIKDTNGNNILVFNAVASAVNYLTISNRATGSLPYLAADGTDTDIDLGLIPKGTGRVAIWKSTGAAEINAGGGDTNVDLNLSTKGTGVVKANNVQVATISDAQTLTNKTLTTPKINQVNDTSGNQQFTTSATDMTMAVDIDMQGRFVWNMHDPVDAQDATTKIYVDNLIIAERSVSTTLTNKTLTNPTVSGYTEGTVTIGTVTTAATIDISNGTVQTATLTASTACTFTMPTAAAGKSFVLFLKQAASTGLGTATFTGVKWPGATAPTISPTAGQMDILTFTSDGTNWYGSFIQGFTP